MNRDVAAQEARIDALEAISRTRGLDAAESEELADLLERHLIRRRAARGQARSAILAIRAIDAELAALRLRRRVALARLQRYRAISRGENGGGLPTLSDAALDVAG